MCKHLGSMEMTAEARRSLWYHLLWGKPAATLEGTQECGERSVRRDPHGGELRPPANSQQQHHQGQWGAILEAIPPAPVHLSGGTSLADTLTATSGESRVRTTELSCTGIPDPQNPREQMMGPKTPRSVQMAVQMRRWARKWTF